MAQFKKLKEFNEAEDEYSWEKLGITIADTELTEKMVFDNTFDRISTLQISGRAVDIPGLTRARNLIEGVVKKFARDQLEAGFTYQPISDVGDAVMQPIRPETFGLPTFNIAEPNPEEDIVPQDASGVYELQDNEIVVVTDFLEVSPNVTTSAVQFTDVDGERKLPEDMRPQIQVANGVGIYPLISPEIIEDRVDLDAKVEYSVVDLELVPLGVHIAKGERTGTLSVAVPAV